MQKVEMKVEMGSLCRDVITGFEGIVVSYTFHLTGCDMVALKPRDLDKDGKPKESPWVDYTRVKVLSGPPSEIAEHMRNVAQSWGRIEELEAVIRSCLDKQPVVNLDGMKTVYRRAWDEREKILRAALAEEE